MGISLNTNFDYKGPLPLDTRLVFDSIAERDAYNPADLYEGIVSYVDGKYYEYTPNISTGILEWQEHNTVQPLDDIEVQEVIDILNAV